ncbi:hypothetical protein WMY93_033691 [Mugilogobius chulae]|uniref:IF rod domain-containing protein n=1 Tax=Mugilogobius chulae TaxID=88201 RepID=A0AAW0MJF1_9GOBI
MSLAPARLYEQEIRDLRARVEELTHEKSQMHVDCVQMNDALERSREKLDEESGSREESGALLDEIAFLRKVHEEELHELQASLQATQVSVEMDMAKPDLAAALKDIRSQYENLSARNQAQAEDWYRSKIATCLRPRPELTEYRRQVQARTLEIEALRGHNEALERQIAEMEDRHNQEIGELQDTIQQLEVALRTTKGEMSHHLREYQDLLNVKMALDIEIAAYRKLLEGEECRLSSVGGSWCSRVTPASPTCPRAATPWAPTGGPNPKRRKETRERGRGRGGEGEEGGDERREEMRREETRREEMRKEMRERMRRKRRAEAAG